MFCLKIWNSFSNNNVTFSTFAKLLHEASLSIHDPCKMASYRIGAGAWFRGSIPCWPISRAFYGSRLTYIIFLFYRDKSSLAQDDRDLRAKSIHECSRQTVIRSFTTFATMSEKTLLISPDIHLKRWSNRGWKCQPPTSALSIVNLLIRRQVFAMKRTRGSLVCYDSFIVRHLSSFHVIFYGYSQISVCRIGFTIIKFYRSLTDSRNGFLPASRWVSAERLKDGYIFMKSGKFLIIILEKLIDV